MTAPTIYSNFDSNGPGYVNQALHFLKVLKACLVDGYAGKPAAGWSLVYDDMDIENATATTLGTKVLFKSASGHTILLIEPVNAVSNNPTFKLSLCEQGFSDGGVTGAVSGEQHNDNPGGLPQHITVSGSALWNWIVAATGETVIFNSRNTNLTYQTGLSGGWSVSVSLYVGKFKDARSGLPEKANIICIGGRRTTGTSSTANSYWDSALAFTLLRGMDGTPLTGRYEAQMEGISHGTNFRGLNPVLQFYRCNIGMADEKIHVDHGLTYSSGSLGYIGSLYGLKRVLFLEMSHSMKDFLLAADPSLANEHCFETPIMLDGKPHFRLENSFGILLATEAAEWE